MNKYSYLIIVFIFIMSCKLSKDENINLENKIENCVNGNIAENRYKTDLEPINTFTVLKEIENVFCKDSDVKNSFINLINLMRKNELDKEKLLSEIDLICKKYDFDLNNNIYRYKECLNVILIQNKVELYSTLHLSTSFLNSIDMEGYDLDQFENFINNYDADDIKIFQYRVIFSLVFYSMISQ
ncbi:hypothetical protein U8527_03105 [Kordia algicida OT-1]|uniref:Lipoprotein n=1 Tax=Kordia algicida OT-1 TaxID=391587 RepID=A9DNX4_9FLAO|nr:hypothetical protein [Kordia algicida]EDP97304.1 hypothetical protein KAOT1_19117 [Kordia algicida OT-1]